MPYYEVVNLGTVTKTNMIDEMPCAYGTLRTTSLRIWHQVLRRAAQRSQLLQISTRTHSDLWSQLATTLQFSFTVVYRSREKWHHCDRRAICNVTRGIGAGRRVICHQGVSEGSDGARPLWRSPSTLTQPFRLDRNVFCWCSRMSCMYQYHCCELHYTSHCWYSPGKKHTISLRYALWNHSCQGIR